MSTQKDGIRRTTYTINFWSLMESMSQTLVLLVMFLEPKYKI